MLPCWQVNIFLPIHHSFCDLKFYLLPAVQALPWRQNYYILLIYFSIAFIILASKYFTKQTKNKNTNPTCLPPKNQLNSQNKQTPPTKQTKRVMATKSHEMKKISVPFYRPGTEDKKREMCVTSESLNSGRCADLHRTLHLASPYSHFEEFCL